MNDGIYDAWKSEQAVHRDQRRVEELAKDPKVIEYEKLRKKLNDWFGKDLY